MLDSGRVGAISAGLTALIGLAQAFLFQSQRRLRVRLLNLTTVYFVGHFLVAVAFFSVWRIPSSLTWRHVAFQLLLENAWVEGMAIVMSLCLRIVYTDPTLHAMFCCVAGVTVVLHIPGFVLLVLDQDSGKNILFGASLLVPTSLLVAFVQIWCSKFDKSPRPIVIGVYSLLNICGLVCLTAIRDANKFLQANVILITITNLIPVSLLLFKSSRLSGQIWPRCSCPNRLIRGVRRGKREPPQPSDDFFTDMPQPSGQVQRLSDGWDTLSLSSKQTTSKSVESRPLSLLLPPAPTYSTLPGQTAYPLSSTILPAFSTVNGAIYVTTEVEVTINTKQDDDLLELETWVFADVHKT